MLRKHTIKVPNLTQDEDEIMAMGEVIWRPKPEE